MAIWMTLRKIAHARGLIASLLLGMVLAGALVALIPAYASMSLNRTFRSELQAYQADTGVYPGMALVTAFYNENDALDVLKDLEQKKLPALADERILSLLESRRDNIANINAILDSLYERTGMSELIRVDNLASTAMQMTIATSRGDVVKTGRLQSLTGLYGNMTLVRGALPGEKQDNIYQALATEEALLSLGAEIGDIISCVPRLDTTFVPIKVQITGTFDVDPAKSLAWGFFKPVMFKDSLLLGSGDARELFLGTPVLAASIRSYVAYDYGQMLSKGLDAFSLLSSELNRELHTSGADFEMPVLKKAADFAAREKVLRTTLLMLNIPVLIMLLMYMAMVSGMVVDSDAGEIALLVSRGASRRFVFIIYLLLGLFLACAALLLGPPLSRVLCRVLGSSNGFLSFVKRSVPEVRAGLESYLYCAAALLIAVGMLAVPAARRQGISIVHQKRMAGGKEKTPLWHRLGLDVLLLLLSVAAWYLMKTRPEWVSASGELNPVIFALMPCFAVGATLFFLRVYPLVVKLLFAAGRPFWRAGAYLSLLRVSRGVRSYRYIMVFLSLTMAVGMFSASAARTLNDNETDRLAYLIGADIRLTVNWPRQGAQSASYAYGGQTSGGTAQESPETRRYQEPSFAPFKELAGVKSAARVFERDAVQVSGAKTAGNVHLTAIDPANFGRTAWYRQDLWSAHFYAYLNALSVNERAVLISASLAERLNAQMGDWVTLGWDGSDSAEFYITGIVNYWPGWDPVPDTPSEDAPALVVADLNTVQALLAMEPYAVWLKLESGADTQALYDDMAAKNIKPTSLRNFRQENIALVNGSARIAVNGVMSLGFIASCIVCALGFLLYWQMYLKKNQLQLGLERGMGFTAGQLLRMLLYEQALTSVAALLWGVLIGIAGSELFVPLFSYSSSLYTAPPFRVRLLAEDRLAIYAIISVMLVFCWIYLAIKMKRMKVAQAIKLGED